MSQKKGQLRNRKQNKRKNNARNETKGKPNTPESKKYAKSSPAPSSSYNAWPGSFIILVILMIIAYNELQFNIPSINSKMSNNKPYQTIESYYPYYLSQHKHPNTQKMHILGSTLLGLIALIKPEVAITTMIGLLFGYTAFPAFRGLDNGLMEVVIIFIVIAFVSHLHGIKKYMLGCALIAYGFAWFGHFYYEENRPATFLYPSYSAICDFKMWGAFYKQLLNTNDWENLWEKGIDFSEALGAHLPQ